MPIRQSSREPEKKASPDRRRAFAVVALALGVLFAVSRTEREGRYAIPGISFGLAPFAPAPEGGTPATEAAARVIAQIDDMQSRVRATRVRHETEIDEARGLYDFDASGMAGWVLSRAAPVAFAAMGRDRPVAEDFARAIHEAPADADTNGWRRLARADALRPGDVIAWETPQDQRTEGLTGHVAIVVGMPVRVPGLDEAWSVEVADATSDFHQWDSRLLGLDFDGGFGRGTITLAVGEDGRPFAYGWQGPWSPLFRRNEIELGRVTR
ncbi:MAG: hypothetical protein U0234_10835 [Sandaracinus sp.]